MSIHDLTSALWRRRALFGATFAAAFLVVVIITITVPRVYEATATVYVGTDETRLDTSQGEQLSRTYTALAGNPNIAEEARSSLHLSLTRDELLKKMSFAPVERTQLLGISAQDGSPEEAQRLADGYAGVFVGKVSQAVAAGEAPSKVALSQPAIVPTDPIRPSPPLYLGFGGLLSLLLAAGAALLRDRLDSSARVGPREEAFAGEPILGRIPTLLEQPQGTDEAGSHIFSAARILSADAFRVLRTNLALAPGEPARTIAITSTESGEGKSTIASQMALTLATDRERVTIVECDLRRQALGGIGSEQRTSSGLAEYMAGEVDKEEIVRSTASLPHLNVIWAGKTVAEPGPLLHSSRLPELLGWLRANNDWVILDTPPIGVGDDALVISSQADGALVVVSSNETPVPVLEAGLGQLRRVGARVLGLVVNRAQADLSGAYRYLLEPAAGPNEEAPAAVSARPERAGAPTGAPETAASAPQRGPAGPEGPQRN